MERSELVADVLGEHVFDFFLRNKRQEWEEYRRQVTEFERKRLLASCKRDPLGGLFAAARIARRFTVSS